MATPPVASALPVAAVIDYYRHIAEATALPLIVQDASSYVGNEIPISVCVELLERYGAQKILFKPEAAPFGPRLSALRDATGGRAAIFEGSGGVMLVDAHRRGITGTMPGTDLLDGIVAIWRALERGDEDAADRIYFPLCALIHLQMQAGLDGFLAIEKHLLVRRGVFPSERRREPLGWKLDPETAAEVDRLFARMQDALRA
jgi:4-hydroxy-tetrahydrodipicolinate synthase